MLNFTWDEDIDVLMPKCISSVLKHGTRNLYISNDRLSQWKPYRLYFPWFFFRKMTWISLFLFLLLFLTWFCLRKHWYINIYFLIFGVVDAQSREVVHRSCSNYFVSLILLFLDEPFMKLIITSAAPSDIVWWRHFDVGKSCQLWQTNFIVDNQ